MEPEERKILERTLKLTEDNNRMLRAMRRSALFGKMMHLLYWAVIIAVSVTAYSFIQPYLGSVTSALNTVNELRNLQEQGKNIMPR